MPPAYGTSVDVADAGWRIGHSNIPESIFGLWEPWRATARATRPEASSWLVDARCLDDDSIRPIRQRQTEATWVRDLRGAARRLVSRFFRSLIRQQPIVPRN